MCEIWNGKSGREVEANEFSGITVRYRYPIVLEPYGTRVHPNCGGEGGSRAEREGTFGVKHLLHETPIIQIIRVPPYPALLYPALLRDTNHGIIDNSSTTA